VLDPVESINALESAFFMHMVQRGEVSSSALSSLGLGFDDVIEQVDENPDEVGHAETPKSGSGFFGSLSRLFGGKHDTQPHHIAPYVFHSF
jgi:hypothetical protein